MTFNNCIFIEILLWLYAVTDSTQSNVKKK